MYGTARIKINGANRARRANDYEGIYDLLEPVIGHAEAEDAASWCELAAIGETWQSDNCDVEIRLED